MQLVEVRREFNYIVGGMDTTFYDQSLAHHIHFLTLYHIIIIIVNTRSYILSSLLALILEIKHYYIKYCYREVE